MASCYETRPEDITSLKHLAQGVQKDLSKLLRDEESQEIVSNAKEGYWAAHQFAEFNLWCTEVGVDDKGFRSIYVRLKDVPGICEMFTQLLLSLNRDFQGLEQSESNQDPSFDETGSVDELLDDVASDASSISFKTLSSLEGSQTEDVVDKTGAAWSRRRSRLQKHVEDTIRRLHGHALQVDRVGAKHRWTQVETYLEKDRHEWTFGRLAEYAYQAVQIYFHSASETIQDRMAQSFARRRTRFKYLKEHQKSRSVEMAKAGLQNESVFQYAYKYAQLLFQGQLPGHSALGAMRSTVVPKEYGDVDTIQITITTEQAGSPSFPGPDDRSFQCPFCFLEIPTLEALGESWIEHVWQDFEPYFCIMEDCKAPFDVPSTFSGWLGHLQDHLEELYHVELPSGEHCEFTEKEYENYITTYGQGPQAMLASIKEARRYKGAFLFQNCPFCDDYPDILDKEVLHMEPTHAQIVLREHIKEHMHNFALLPPPDAEEDPEADNCQYVVTHD